MEIVFFMHLFHRAKGDDSEAASLRDESSSVPLSQLLAEMACPSLENSTEQGGEVAQPVNEAPNNLPGKTTILTLDRLSVETVFRLDCSSAYSINSSICPN